MSALGKRIVSALSKNAKRQQKLTFNGALAAFVAYDGKRFKPAEDPANELTTEEKVQLLIGIHDKRWNLLGETQSLKDSLHDICRAELDNVDVSALSDADCQGQYFCQQLEAFRETCDDVSDASSKLEVQLEELERAIAELQAEYVDLKKRRECRSAE
ncbi:hypothetical protein AAVH_20449 [Aphelenchoides avenae]|nr:hypothetical protein AAVH_20449 [Aphelenchus avenae]